MEGWGLGGGNVDGRWVCAWKGGSRLGGWTRDVVMADGVVRFGKVRDERCRGVERLELGGPRGEADIVPFCLGMTPGAAKTMVRLLCLNC